MFKEIKAVIIRIAAGVLFLAAGIIYCIMPDDGGNTETFSIRRENTDSLSSTGADNTDNPAGERSGAGNTAVFDKESMDINSTAAPADGHININTADEAQLLSLPGIGPAKAEAIIAYRTENGAFAVKEELMNVPGIKEGTFSKIEDLICCE